MTKMDSILGKDVEKIVDKTVARIERIDFNFERSSTVGKMLSNRIAHYVEIVCEKKNQSMWQTLLLS